MVAVKWSDVLMAPRISNSATKLSSKEQKIWTRVNGATPIYVQGSESNTYNVIRTSWVDNWTGRAFNYRFNWISKRSETTTCAVLRRVPYVWTHQRFQWRFGSVHCPVTGYCCVQAKPRTRSKPCNTRQFGNVVAENSSNVTIQHQAFVGKQDEFDKEQGTR